MLGRDSSGYFNLREVRLRLNMLGLLGQDLLV